MTVLFGIDLNVISSIRRSIILVSVPVLLLVLCITILAGVSSDNTSIHISTDFLYY